MTKKRKTKRDKSNSSTADFVLLFLLPIVVVIFISLFLKAEIKTLQKEIYQKEKKVEIMQNQLEARMVDVQKLSAESRIVEIAKSKLGMVRINGSIQNIFVSKLKIDQIKRIVDSKYE